MEGEHAAREDVGAETETAGRKMGKWKEVKEEEVRFIMQWRVKIRKEGREAPVDSKDRKPQLHSHVHSLIHTRTHTAAGDTTLHARGLRPCSCVAPRPSYTVC